MCKGPEVGRSSLSEKLREGSMAAVQGERGRVARPGVWATGRDQDPQVLIFFIFETGSKVCHAKRIKSTTSSPVPSTRLAFRDGNDWGRGTWVVGGTAWLQSELWGGTGQVQGLELSQLTAGTS